MTSERRVVRDNAQSPLRRPWLITAVLGIVVVIVFVINALDTIATTTNQLASGSFRRFALTPIFVDDGQLWRLLTSSLLHSTVWTLLPTLLTLVLVGVEVESRWGAARYLLTLATIALAASTAVVWIEPKISRFALGTPLAVGIAAAALMVARRAGFRVWAILGVALLDIATYLFIGRESSKVGLAAAAAAGALIAFLLVIAPQDRRRDRYQFMMIGALICVIVLVLLLHVILTGA